ncbi:MAG: TlpA family protein disulfide reductase [Mycobacterium leprae]
MVKKALLVLLALFCLSAAYTASHTAGSAPRPQNATTAVPAPDAVPTAATSAAPAVRIGLAVGNRAPDFTLPTLGGAKVQLSSLRGKPVLVNFWATWCPPCRQEMPDIQAYYTEHEGQVEIVAVNLTEQERSVGAVAQFMTDRQFTFPVYLDQNGDTANRYAVQAVPTSYFIDKDGIIRASAKGAMRPQDLAAGFKLAGLQ